MTSQTDSKELQNTSCQISQRSKISQTRKFGQLIEYNMRLFFLKSHTVNMMKRLALGLFSKIKVGLSLDQQSQFLYNLIFFYCMSKSRITKTY